MSPRPNLQDSTSSGCTDISNVWPANGLSFSAIRFCWVKFSRLGDLYFSNPAFASIERASAAAIAARALFDSVCNSAIRSFALAVSATAFAVSARAMAISLLDSAMLPLACSKSAFAFAVSDSNSAIFTRDCSRNVSQWCSFTFDVRTITNVAITPAIKLTTNTRLAMSPQSVAAGSDISENGHIRFPDWLFIGGITIILMGGVISIWFQIRNIYHRWRHDV